MVMTSHVCYSWNNQNMWIGHFVLIIYTRFIGKIQPLQKGGVPVSVPQKKEMLGHYFPLFVNFIHGNNKFSIKKERCQVTVSPLPPGSATVYIKNTHTCEVKTVLTPYKGNKKILLVHVYSWLAQEQNCSIC